LNGADGIVINMVVGGEVATLKALEENSGLLIAEMPIHVRYTPLFILLSSSILLRSNLNICYAGFRDIMIVPIVQNFRSYCSISTLTTHGFTSATLILDCFS